MALEVRVKKPDANNNAIINALKQENEKLKNTLYKKDAKISKLEKENTKNKSTIKNLKDKLYDKTEMIQDMRKELQVMHKSLKDAFKKNKRLQIITENQDRRLDVHENAHVPPSKQGPFNKNGTGSKKRSSTSKGRQKPKKDGGNQKQSKSKQSKPKQTKTKRGGVKNHAGKTQVFKATQKQRHTASKCPNCNKEEIQDLGKDEKRTMVSIPEFIPHTVTKHLTAQYKCLCCGDEFKADNGLPENGQFNHSVIRYVAYQYSHRKTAKMIAEDFHNLYGLEVTGQTVSEIFGRGTRRLKPTRDGFMAELERSPAVLMDETVFEGEPKREILAVRNDDTVVFGHAQNRSAKDLISQAKDCIGIVIRDGYPGYDAVFPNHIKQRCTQHIGREGKNIAKRTDLTTAIKLYNELAGKFVMLRKWTRGKHSKKVRIKYVEKHLDWIYDLASRYSRCHHRLLKKFATTLKNAAPQMFTFLLYPFVPSTTNLAEQSIKQVIGQRNSRGQLKSDKGAERLCIMLSCVETWKLRKLNVWDELRKVIGPRAVSNN